MVGSLHTIRTRLKRTTSLHGKDKELIFQHNLIRFHILHIYQYMTALELNADLGPHPTHTYPAKENKNKKTFPSLSNVQEALFPSMKPECK